MDGALSPADIEFKEKLSELLRRVVPSRIRERNLAGLDVPPEDLRESQRILNDHGIAVPGWPVEWGGTDWPPLRKLIWRAALARAGVPDPLAFNTAMVGPVVAEYGSEEQKRRFLPPTASLDIWWAQGFSEPSSGSDLASLQTKAVRDGDVYVVSGQKTWTTLGQHADWIFCLVRTDPGAAKPQQGISFLLIDMSTLGVSVRPIKLIDGGHEVNDVFFDEVRVPVANLVGQENMGWTYAKFLLGNERVFSADVTRIQCRLTRLKQRLGQSVAPAPQELATLMRIAEVENDVLALEALWIRAAMASGSGSVRADLASALKLRGSELAQAVTELELDTTGPSAMRMHDGPWPSRARSVGADYLNMRKVTIYGGSSEIQRTIIATSLLGA